MVFENERLHLQLIDVLKFDDYGVVMKTRSRPFNALSLRIEGDTDIDIRGETVHMTSHDLAFFPTNLPYQRRSKRDLMVVFHFNITNGVFRELEVLHDFEYNALLPMFLSAYEQWHEKAPGYFFHANALLNRIFAHIRENSAPKTERLSAPISAAVEYIAANYSDPELSVEQLAAAAHISGTYFRQLFSRDMGITPKKYITDLRLEHAQSLLNAGYDTVASVAEKVGFGDAKNFATAFKNHFGYPPSKQDYTQM